MDPPNENSAIGVEYRMHSIPLTKPILYRIVSWILVFAHITTFSILGTIIRMALGIAQISLPTNLFFESYLANIVGCFIMGIFYEWIVLYLPTIHNIYYKAPIKRVYAAVATGLCGSITSFSQWQQESAYNLSRGLVGSFFMKQAQGLFFSFSAFHIGRHCYLTVY
jgi:fluoride ion exporter CrcB/FEX